MIISDAMSAGAANRKRWMDYAGLALLIAGLAVPFSLGYGGYRLLPAGPATVKNETVICCVLFLGYGFTVFCALGANHLLSHIFQWAPLRWLGNMSYSFYLTHGLPMHVVAMLVARTHVETWVLGKQLLFIALLLPVAFLSTCLCATVLFLLVEKPFSLKLKRRSMAQQVV